MMKLPVIFQRKLRVTCDKCGKTTTIEVPYHCVQHDFPCNEVCMKGSIEPRNLVYACNCDELKKKVYDEYLKMDSNFTVEH